MRKVSAFAFVVLALLLSSVCAHANPLPSFEDQMAPSYWLIKTLPFNYAVDFISLCLALLVIGQTQLIAWRMVPAYNIMVVIAGYISDFGARAISQYPAYYPTAKDPILGVLMGSRESDLSQFTFTTGVSFMTAATVLIFIFNLAIIYFILHVNDADHRGRLPFSAAVVAVLTSPYIALRGGAVAAWSTPFLLVTFCLGAFLFAKSLMETPRPKRRR